MLKVLQERVQEVLANKIILDEYRISNDKIVCDEYNIIVDANCVDTCDIQTSYEHSVLIH